MKIYNFIFILIGVIVHSQNQKQNGEQGLKITYEYNTTLPPTGNFETYLYIDNEKSQYVHHQKEGIYTTESGYKLTLPYFYYINDYNFASQKIKENRYLKEGIKLYAEWDNSIKWTITNEEKTINGFRVRKAITKSFEIEEDDNYYYGDAIAWFTSEIPYGTGPGRYYGLPGLILELEYANTKNSYKVKSIEKINLSDYDFVKMDDKYKVDDKEDVIYFFHKNPTKVKKIYKNKK